ncbi:MAG: aminotransferase class IV [bacterium]|nr:aminotransferase class IV [bacterium]
MKTKTTGQGLQKYPFIGPDTNTPHHPWVWLNGDVIPTRRCGFSPWTHVIHYATGVISGIGFWKGWDGVYRGFRWPDHIRRLLNNLEAMGLETSFNETDLMQALRKTSCRNLSALTEADDLYLRAFAFQGSEALGVGSRGKTNVAIVTRDLTDYLKLGTRPGATVLYPATFFRRQHPSQGFPYAKAVSNYNRGALFKGVVAQQLGITVDEVLAEAWNGDELAETTGSNIFVVINGVVHTPRLESWCLDGITRKTIISIARALDIKVVDNQPVTREMLFHADEVFLTGTWSGVVPVSEILFDLCCLEMPKKIYAENGGADFLPWLKNHFHPIPIKAPFVGETGPITAKLRKIYWRIVRGKTKIHGLKMTVPPDWHTTI